MLANFVPPLLNIACSVVVDSVMWMRLFHGLTPFKEFLRRICALDDLYEFVDSGEELSIVVELGGCHDSVKRLELCILIKDSSSFTHI